MKIVHRSYETKFDESKFEQLYKAVSKKKLFVTFSCLGGKLRACSLDLKSMKEFKEILSKIK